MKGNRYLIRGPVATGFTKRGVIFYFRILGFGAYHVQGERWYLLLPGLPPKRYKG